MSDERDAEIARLRAELDALRGIYDAQCRATIAAREERDNYDRLYVATMADRDRLGEILLSAPLPCLETKLSYAEADDIYADWYSVNVAPLKGKPMNANESFEAAAAEFQRLTGYMAPAKDQIQGPPYEERYAAWKAWCALQAELSSLRAESLKLTADCIRKDAEIAARDRVIEAAFAALDAWEDVPQYSELDRDHQRACSDAHKATGEARRLRAELEEGK